MTSTGSTIQESESLRTTKSCKSKDKVPIENVEFLSSGTSSKDKEGWGKVTPRNQRANRDWSPPLAAAYDYPHQQQHAYYAQPMYAQHQYPGYVPRSQFYQGACSGYPMQPQVQMQQQQQNLHLPNLYLRSGTPFAAAAAATSPNGSPATCKSHSSDDDECVGLLPRRLTKVGGYGSTNSNTSTKTTNHDTGRTFTFTNLSISSNQRSQEKARPKLGRTRSDGFSLGSTKTATNSKSQHPLHRTTNNNSHVQKPPMSHSPRNPQRKPQSPKHGRSNSLSAAAPGPLGGILAGQRHRRTTSNASSVGAGSLVSEASFMSITADIRKSAFYGGVDESTGKATWHYPNQHIYVCTDNPALVVGKVYKVAVDEEAFEEYHRQAEDRMWEDDLEEMELYNPHQQYRCCTCKCPTCVSCLGHDSNHPRRSRKDPFGALPGNQFALAVDPTVYKRVLDEISQAQQMPCGLFFCGHHEDVAHPSIAIALVMVVAVFVILGTLAYMLPA